MFDEKSKQQLKAYVYMLIDPRDNRPFYIGKGNNNRVFNHLDFAINNEDEKTLKLDTIREIINAKMSPLHIIVRHGLTDDEAFHVESALIDLSDFLGTKLSNIVSGHNSIEKGLMTSEAINAIYNAEPLTGIESDCAIININRTYKRHSGSEAIYLATKETWKMKDPTGKITTVLSEYC